ncbi:MAG TPA: hypothetical protein VLI92_04690 [Candidatus Saccharimonadales bacterium]|nr:hypothetical protein [Candidatus Saccharimonadales bacterium]
MMFLWFAGSFFRACLRYANNVLENHREIMLYTTFVLGGLVGIAFTTATGSWIVLTALTHAPKEFPIFVVFLCIGLWAVFMPITTVVYTYEFKGAMRQRDAFIMGFLGPFASLLRKKD